MKSLAVLVVSAALAVLSPAVASAATIPVSTTGSAPNRVLNIGTLSAATRVTVSRDTNNNLYVQGNTGDTFSPAAPAGCTVVNSDLNCGSGIATINFTGSGGNDDFSMSPDITANVTARGNGGNDEISTGSGNDQLFGGAGQDTLRGGAGNDTISGDDGNDFILGELGADLVDGGAGADTMFGGGQAGDTLNYVSRTKPVTVDLTAGTGGEVGEGDAVADFTAVRGGSGDDTLVGGPTADRLEGNNGNDTLLGGEGNDSLDGGNGNDALSGGAGVDGLSGGADADYLDARDQAVDAAIACGAGTDRLIGDPADPAAADCEVVAPSVVGEITISGSAAEGGTLGATFSGQVTGTDSTRGWLWSRCGEAGCAIVGQDATYAPTAADAGAVLIATLRAANDAGAGELGSAPVGPVVAIPAAVAPPPTSAAPVPATLKVKSASCSGKTCKLTLTVSGDVAFVKAALTKGKKTYASVTKQASKGTVKLTFKAKRTLAKGTYKLKVTVTGTDKRSKSSTRTVKVKRR